MRSLKQLPVLVFYLLFLNYIFTPPSSKPKLLTMKKLALLTIGLLLLGFSISAQISRGGKPFSFSYPLHDNLGYAKPAMKPSNDIRGQSRTAFMFPYLENSEFSEDWRLLYR